MPAAATAARKALPALAQCNLASGGTLGQLTGKGTARHQLLDPQDRLVQHVRLPARSTTGGAGSPGQARLPIGAQAVLALASQRRFVGGSEGGPRRTGDAQTSWPPGAARPRTPRHAG